MTALVSLFKELLDDTTLHTLWANRFLCIGTSDSVEREKGCEAEEGCKVASVVCQGDGWGEESLLKGDRLSNNGMYVIILYFIIIRS